MEDIFRFSDDLGPAKVLHVHEPSIGLKGVLVVDNVAAGPSIGGLRMASDVSTEECVRLARAMTMKNAAAGLPHGGGKSVLYGDPKMPREEKEPLIRAMACALRDISEYILAPDMGTDEECMAWIKDEIGRVVGLPRAVGGIPLDELGATGWGISHVADVAARECGLELKGARLVVQGFGAVGTHSARFLGKKGVVLVGACDSRGAIYNPEGLDVDILIELKKTGRSVAEYEDGESMERDAVIDMECDIWIPAARPDVIHEDNVDRLKTRLIISGANIPITEGAEQILHEKGILNVPDFIANAGGVICAAMEYKKVPRSIAFQAIGEKVTENVELVLMESKEEGILPREAAVRLATTRLRVAMDSKRWSIY
jgi:glutamate dehydrogenase (NAD(P)+)